MIRLLLSITLVLSILSCSKNQVDNNTVTDQKEVKSTEDIEAVPTVDSKVEDTEVVANSSYPEYMDLELRGYGTPNINLKDLHGKVVFINHWGSWCPPCRREMPSVQSLYDAYGDKVEFVMIATEKQPGAHVPYIEKNGFTFPVYSMNSPASTEIKPKGFPTTIILDKKGEIKTNEVGAADWNSPQVREFLDQLVAE